MDEQQLRSSSPPIDDTEMPQRFSVSQNIFTTTHSDIPVAVYDVNALKPALVVEFLESVKVAGHMGIAAVYGRRGALVQLFISTSTRVIVLVNLKDPMLEVKQSHRAHSGWQTFKREVLLSAYPKYALRMDKLALALHHDHGIRITHGIDLLSLHPNRDSVEAFLHAFGGKSYWNHIDPDNARKLYRELEELRQRSPEEKGRLLALEAWLVCHAATMDHVVADAPTISTDALSDAELDVLSVTFRNQLLLDRLKPLQSKNEVAPSATQKDGNVKLMSERYKTRIVRSQSQSVEIVAKQDGKTVAFRGRVTRVRGREATVSCRRPRTKHRRNKSSV
ncbi:hypothetical protein BDZ89DRAFT_430040 [Hymenopellis radicata]|nr:hypothetical protein BDZ89DRAFT_430040 [Hymenopellis radicata]